MPFNYIRTKRPHEALLDLYIDKNLNIVERRREALGPPMEHLPCLFLNLTYSAESRKGTVYGC